MTNRTPGENPRASGDNPRKANNKNFMATISKFVKKLFQLLKYVVHLIGELLQNTMHLITFTFTILVKLLSEPSTPCVVAIIAFIGVSAVAASQWYLIGVWLGSNLGINGIYGIGTGAAGVMLGLGINVFQLSPQLWKLRKDVAQAFQKLDIKTDDDGNDEGNVGNRLKNWNTYDYVILKKFRLLSYGIETALVLSYCFFNGLNFFGIITAAISLILPEKTLEFASATISVHGKVSNHINDHEPDHVHL